MPVVMRRSWIGILALLAGCSLFSPRTPEPPAELTGTYLQPDTPQRVIENIQHAIRERQTQNYVRSLHETFRFEPDPAAQTREPSLWEQWGKAEEQAYFSRLVASAQPTASFSLQLFDVQEEYPRETLFRYQATYLLRVPHQRIDEGIPEEVQGHLLWVIERAPDGLWYITRWIDQKQGNAPTWSDLKADFIR